MVGGKQMKSRVTLMALMLVMLTIACLTAASKNLQDTDFKLPPGKWTLQHPAISRLGLKDAPLQIISVTGSTKSGGTITEVRLKNNSGKATAGVKFNWYLFRDQAPKEILRKGESPVLGLVGLSAGGRKNVTYPIVSFGNIWEPLLKDGELNGDFVLEVAVSEITYEDGSKWERK